MSKFTLKSLQEELSEICYDFTFESNGKNDYGFYCRWGEGTVGFSDACSIKWARWTGPLHSRDKEVYLRAARKLSKKYKAQRALSSVNPNLHAVW